MKWTCLLAACLSVAFSATSAQAVNYVVSSAGPLDSVGYTGNAGNAVIQDTYAGAQYFADVYSFSGVLHRVNASSLAMDSTWDTKVFFNSAFQWGSIPVMTTATNYSALSIARVLKGAYWVKPSMEFRFEAVENAGVDDPGIDAQWTNVNFEFHAAGTFTNIGWSAGDVINANSYSSTQRTQMGVFSAAGELLEYNDGNNSGLPTELDLSGLTAGEYYLVVSSEGGAFGDYAALPGPVGGDLQISVGGASVFDGVLDDEDVQIVRLSVVPEPATAMLLTAGVLGFFLFARRRALPLRSE